MFDFIVAEEQYKCEMRSKSLTLRTPSEKVQIKPIFFILLASEFSRFELFMSRESERQRLEIEQSLREREIERGAINPTRPTVGVV